MRRFLFAAGALALGLGLVACATPTPYQPAAPTPSATGYNYGYRDLKIDDTHWRVTFSGNSLTSRETVEKYLLYRAAELTKQQGFDWFQATDRATDKQTSFYGGDPYYGWGWGPRWSFGGPWGWRAWGPWGGPGWPGGLDMQQVDRFEASAEIDMGHGATPEGRRAFNAAEVIQNLGPSIARPKT